MPGLFGQVLRGADVFADMAAPESASSEIDRADSLIDNGGYDEGVAVLKAVIAKNGRTAADGANASFDLMARYRDHCDYQFSLAEGRDLLAALPQDPYTDADGEFPGRDEVKKTIGIVQFECDQLAKLQSTVDASRDPALRLDAQGDVLRLEQKVPEAAVDWQKAYELVAGEPNASQSIKLKIEKDYRSTFFVDIDAAKALPQMVAASFAILRDPNASAARRELALDMKEDADHRIAITSTMRLYAPPYKTADYVQALAPSVSSNNVEVSRLVRDQLIDSSMRAEVDGDWNEAIEADKLCEKNITVKQRSATDKASLPEAMQDALQARRSIPLLTAVANLTKSPDCSFLGIDHTLKSSWEGSVGHEAWVLFAMHGTDECGGPALMNGSFSYKTSIGDPSNQVRRWRDPVGYPHRPGEVPLVDPVSGSEPVYSFLDDNGETYRNNVGPDLYVDLTIPAGRHILSLPLHFSFPAGIFPNTDNPHYGILTFRPLTPGEAPQCIMANIVSLNDEPGMARIALTGPAKYTLVIRREDSYNANLPALFLDTDMQYTAPPPLTDAFSLQQIEQAEAHSPGEQSADSLTGLARLIARYEIGSRNPAQANWQELAKAASAVASGSSLSAGQRSIAAYISWRADERSPLDTAGVSDALQQYVTLRFADPEAQTASRN